VTLIVHRAGPAMSIQDMGRTGFMAQGLSAGGAADPLALIEGAVLLGHTPQNAALEMAGMGGTFEAREDTWIALTGAPMAAKIGERQVPWNASHALDAGQVLTIGGATAGGFQTASRLNSRAAHLGAGLGGLVQAGDHLPVGTGTPSAARLPDPHRFSGGKIRVLPSVHTHMFSEATRAQFAATTFQRAARGNRQGVALECEGTAFGLDHTTGGQLTILSEPMLAGDIQMTGDGRPFVLLAECQTTGGYPRIATVVPNDVPVVAQAQAGADLRFVFVDHDAALAAHRSTDQIYADLSRHVQPLVRDPRAVVDLLSYQLIDGAVTGFEDGKG